VVIAPCRFQDEHNENGRRLVVKPMSQFRWRE
jgi:hypothetical protein